GEAAGAQAQEEGLHLLQGQEPGHRLQGHEPPAEVHLRPREDPRAPGVGQLLAAPARRGHRGEELAGDGPAALHLDRAL
ncbi:MAG: SSU ribosomal protein S18p @ SSU ribosomal protein S18p, zinc-dependent, partial [uncultured Actinomycetospora sp.]